jgi:enoyl-CoA hydratase
MSYECFEVSIDNGLAHLRMNRPERRNAMTAAFWKELPQIVRGLEARVLVLSSTGPHFCAGLDVSMFSSGGLTTESVKARKQFREKLEELQASLNSLAEARFPVIEAFFVIQEINLGMMADVGTFNRMPKQLPEAVVRELGYTGDRLTAERAERLGFVNGLFDTHEQLVAGALEVARRIASKAPVAVAATKQMISYTRDHPVAESFAYLNALQPAIFDIEEIKRALKSQKRA